jgi:hypothetical protein
VLFMVIERFREGARPVYARFEAQGRLMPDDVTVIDSWADAALSRVFQLMESESVAPVQSWVANWQDLIDFEVVPVVPGREVAAAIRATR